jgi:hypothetical protein
VLAAPNQALDKLVQLITISAKPVLLRQMRLHFDPKLLAFGVRTTGLWEEVASKDIAELKDLVGDMNFATQAFTSGMNLAAGDLASIAATTSSNNSLMATDGLAMASGNVSTSDAERKVIDFLTKLAEESSTAFFLEGIAKRLETENETEKWTDGFSKDLDIEEDMQKAVIASFYSELAALPLDDLKRWTESRYTDTYVANKAKELLKTMKGDAKTLAIGKLCQKLKKGKDLSAQLGGDAGIDALWDVIAAKPATDIKALLGQVNDFAAKADEEKKEVIDKLRTLSSQASLPRILKKLRAKIEETVKHAEPGKTGAKLAANLKEDSSCLWEMLAAKPSSDLQDMIDSFAQPLEIEEQLQALLKHTDTALKPRLVANLRLQIEPQLRRQGVEMAGFWNDLANVAEIDKLNAWKNDLIVDSEAVFSDVTETVHKVAEGQRQWLDLS